MKPIPAIRVHPSLFLPKFFTLSFSVAISPDQNRIVIFAGSDKDPGTLLLCRSFKVGDLAEYNSLKIASMGKIAAISCDGVTIYRDSNSLNRNPIPSTNMLVELSLYDFCSINWY